MNVSIFWVCATECMCAQTRPPFILSYERAFGEWSQNPCELQGANPFYPRLREGTLSHSDCKRFCTALHTKSPSEAVALKDNVLSSKGQGLCPQSVWTVSKDAEHKYVLFFTDHSLDGLAVRASASSVVGPGFCCQLSHTWLKIW